MKSVGKFHPPMDFKYVHGSENEWREGWARRYRPPTKSEYWIITGAGEFEVGSETWGSISSTHGAIITTAWGATTREELLSWVYSTS